MIRVPIELVPHGIGKPIKIGVLYITNDGTGTPERGNYYYAIYGKRKRLMRRGIINSWPRRQRHVWRLVAQALKVLG